MTEGTKEVMLNKKLYRFFRDVYPNFYARSWLGKGPKHDLFVDLVIDDIIDEISRYRR